MLIEKAFNGFYYCISSFACIFVLLISILFSQNVIANNLNQSEYIAESDNTLNLKSVLKNSSLPLINEVSKLYESRQYNLIWSDGIQYNNRAHNLYRVIQNIRKLGLNPADYDIDVLKYFLEVTQSDPVILSKSDVTFTHAYLKLASHITKEQFSSSYSLQSNFALLDDEVFLSNTLNENNQKNELETTLKNFPIDRNPYSRLLNALEKYRSLNDDFEPIILQKRSLTIGDVSFEVIKARKRLFEFGDYKDNDLYNDIFDEELALAISAFQYRHGLEVDGILGKRTVREINKSSQSRATQIELNLDRARKLSELQDERYILVNVPEYKLYVIEKGKTVYETRVIVGKKKNKTPVLSSEISEFVLNPYWNIPKSITRDEIIPKQLKDPEYLEKNNMRVISRVNSKNYFLDPETIDWNNVDVSKAPLRIRQNPGEKNALGRVKFVFPNNYKVYLHDTPSRRLFSRTSRAFSHGCVRVENPIEFAEVLLSNSETWTKDDLYYFANRKKTKVFKLDKAIPIHITYLTAWVDNQGILNFRPDIYKQDSHFASNLYNASE